MPTKMPTTPTALDSPHGHFSRTLSFGSPPSQPQTTPDRAPKTTPSFDTNPSFPRKRESRGRDDLKYVKNYLETLVVLTHIWK